MAKPNYQYQKRQKELEKKKKQEEKRKRKKLPLLAANLVQHAIGADDNEITLFDDEGAHPLARAPKDAVARDLVAHIAKLYKKPART